MITWDDFEKIEIGSEQLRKLQIFQKLKSLYTKLNSLWNSEYKTFIYSGEIYM